MFDYRGKLHRVVDGDTVDLILDLGFHVSMSVRFRLLGFDAPELHSPGGIEAKEALYELLVDKPLLVDSHKADKYGRWLATIQLPDGRSATEVMVAAGHLKPGSKWNITKDEGFQT